MSCHVQNDDDLGRFILGFTTMIFSAELGEMIYEPMGNRSEHWKVRPNSGGLSDPKQLDVGFFFGDGSVGGLYHLVWDSTDNTLW